MILGDKFTSEPIVGLVIRNLSGETKRTILFLHNNIHTSLRGQQLRSQRTIEHMYRLLTGEIFVFSPTVMKLSHEKFDGKLLDLISLRITSLHTASRFPLGENMYFFIYPKHSDSDEMQNALIQLRSQTHRHRILLFEDPFTSEWQLYWNCKNTCIFVFEYNLNTQMWITWPFVHKSTKLRWNKSSLLKRIATNFTVRHVPQAVVARKLQNRLAIST